MNDAPIFLCFPDVRAAAMAIRAWRNEAGSLDSLERHADAIELRAMADQLQRKSFAVRPLHYKPAPIDIVLEPSPGVSAVVAEYRVTE